MRDALGSYYYPYPADTRSRVYVREGTSGPEFRLWHADHPVVWEKHGWIPQAALEEAAAMYRAMGRESDPMALYDAAVARALVEEDRTCRPGTGKPR